MSPFDILSSSTPIYRNALLEASAGTGKTFAIEHLIVRLLLEPIPNRGRPCQLNEILAVTFTRAATRELKVRIRSNIEKALTCLRTAFLSASMPGYLRSYMEGPADLLEQACLRLEDALSCFDEAQVFTLHGFCAQLLRDHLGHSATRISENPASAILLKMIKHFFRTELRPDLCSPLQLKRLVGHFRGDMELLQAALLKTISRQLLVAPEPTYLERFAQFREIMKDLVQSQQWKPTFILEDFDRQVAFYHNLDKVKPKSLRSEVTFMAQLFGKADWSLEDFDRLLRDGCVLARLELRKNRKALDSATLHYPQLREVLQQKLLPLVTATIDPHRIFGALAHHLQAVTNLHLSEEETGGPDQLLPRVLTACEDPQFLAKARQKYRFAIVDEFQDTDPVQWQLLQLLFLDADPAAYLVLVGDPKQSIYAFRQADIYTYLDAAQRFPAGHRLALSVNYRSQAPLVRALNGLFDEKNNPGLIALPRHDTSLPYPPVQAAPTAPEHSFSDSLGPVHFFLLKASRTRLRTWPGEQLEKTHLVPFVAAEIARLTTVDGIHYKQIAILVHSRYQASLVQEVLTKWNIPSMTQRQESLADSPALPALVEWLEAMMCPQDLSAVRRALAGPIGGWTPSQLLDAGDSWNQAIQQLQHLRRILIDQGIAMHSEELWQSRWGSQEGPTLLERLLQTPQGRDLYRDLKQILNTLIEHQSTSHCDLEGLLLLLDRFEVLAAHDDERLRIQQDPHLDAVRILTMHMSKGLEFDIVFALGLVRRSGAEDLLVPDTSTCPPQLRAAEDDSAIYRQFCREADAEKVRQAYVAMTRAKYRLYLPVAIAEEGSTITWGEASPMELLLARLGQLSVDSTPLYECINRFDGRALCEFLDAQKAKLGITYQWLDTVCPICVSRMPSPPQPQLEPPPHATVPPYAYQAHSFTSLQASQRHREEVPTGAPHDENAAECTAHTLPAGRETGILLHGLLETLPFSTLLTARSATDLLPLLTPQLDGHPLAAWSQVIAEVLFRAVCTPLPLLDGPTALCSVDSRRHYRELEFLYHAPNLSSLGLASKDHHLLRGSIDLVFAHQGRYYLIDWKTNWLGPTAADYGPEVLRSAVQQHGYEMQARIYREALERYLRLVDPRPFSQIFGGVYFLFLRGLGADASNAYSGIYKAECS